MVMTKQGNVVVSVEDQDGHAPANSRRRTKRLVAVVTTVVLVLGAGGGAAWSWNSDQNERLAAARAELEKAESAAREAVTAGRTALEQSEGKVADDAVRVALADLLDNSRGPFQTNDGSRAEQTEAIKGAAKNAAAEAAAIVAATSVVTDAVAAWELEQAQAGYVAALAQLGTAVDAGAALLSSSEGKVSDDAVRQTLAAAIETATGLRAAQAPTSVDELTTASSAVADATAAVSAATTGVSDNQAAWQAEQDRIAAEQAAAAAAAAKSSAAAKAAKKATTSSGSSTSSGGSSASGSSGSSTSGRRLGSNPGSHPVLGTPGTTCTTPSCGITF